MRILSDFKDFYDDMWEDDGGRIYKRKRKEIGRTGELKILRDLGIPTIKIKAVREFNSTAKNLVVYTNHKKHDCLGKRVVDYNDAQLMYENMLASEFVEEANGITFKYLQIGYRRFRLYMKNETPFEMQKGKVIEVQEISPSRGNHIGCPIFSIDYINVNGELIAIDFNEVQHLGELGMDRILTKEEVTEEILKVLV